MQADAYIGRLDPVWIITATIVRSAKTFTHEIISRWDPNKSFGTWLDKKWKYPTHVGHK